jgi:predicted AlkP superfamily phosphohydrolase/phosphomutase
VDRLFVIGLDCAEPSLVFDRWKEDLPNLRGLMDAGVYGPLESTVPPITVPAWSCMLTGKDPGELGFYGFRNRADHSYHQMGIATSAAVKHARIWGRASAAGKRVVVVNVPQTYPPRPLNGYLVSSFLTPSTFSEYTYPRSLKAEIAQVVADYRLDVSEFRTEDKSNLLRQIYDMTEKRCRLVKHLLRTKPWEFFMWVEMGVDRIHHGLWKYMDAAHPKHEPGNPYEDAIRQYYRYVDDQIGEMLELIPDDAAVLVVSDHGAQAMQGGICINEWLMREGYLVLEYQPAGLVPLAKCEVDWRRTTAWGSGGYYGRLFLNVEGREPEGLIPQRAYEATRDELIGKLESMTDPEGHQIGSRVYKPQEVYREVNNIPPDLIVYFGDLAWRSVGSVGLDAIHTFENDTGPDDANHARNGLFILAGPGLASRGRVPTRSWQSIAPTMMGLLGLGVPEGMEGKSMLI